MGRRYPEDYNKNLLTEFITTNTKGSNFFGNIKIIYSDINLGYGGGNNLGIKNSKGNIILLLNNDTVHSVSFLEEMSNFFEKYKFIHIAQPLIYYLKEKDKIWSNGYKFFKFSYFLLKNLNFIEIATINRPYRIDSADGCAFLIRRDILKEIGLLENIFFIYGETAELCYRAKLKGFTNIYCNPLTKIYHDTQPGFSELHKKYFFRNRMMFLLKHFSLSLIVVQSLMLLIRLFLISIAIKKKRFDYKFIFNTIKKMMYGLIVGLKRRLN